MIPQPPPTLSEIQSWMKWIVTDPRGVTGALENLPTDPETPARYQEPSRRCLDFISEAGSKTLRLDVYAEAYFSRLLEVLMAEFPRLVSEIGENEFQSLAARYFKKNPSYSYNINDVSAQLPKFLETDRLLHDWPYLADLAHLEIMQTRAHYSSPSSVWNPGLSVTEGLWENGKVSFHDSVKILETKWNFEQTPFHAQTGHYLCHQKQGLVFLRRLEHLEAVLLQELLSGKNISESLATAAEFFATESILSSLGPYFQTWIQTHLIREIYL